MKASKFKSWLSFKVALIATMLGITTNINAEDKFYLNDFTINPGETKTLAIQLESTNVGSDPTQLNYVAFQFDMYLPEGLTVDMKRGKYNFAFNEARKDDHTLTFADQADGSIRVFGASLSNAYFWETAGDFITFSVTAANNFSGTKEIKLNNVQFATKAGELAVFANTIATVKVPEPEVPEVPETPTVTTDKFYLNDFTINPGETKTLAIQLESSNVGSDPTQLNYVAFQFDMYLPEGLTVDMKKGKYNFAFNEARKDDHTLTFADQADGSIRVFGASLSNAYFWETAGDFITFSVTAANNFSGTKEIKLNNVQFATKAGELAVFANTIATVKVPEPEVPEVPETPTVTTDKFYLNDFTINPGETKTLAIQLESSNVGSDSTQLNYVAFQFDMYLPEGLTVDMKRGKYNFAFNEARKDDHTLTFADQADGSIRVFGASLSNAYFWETAGDFITFSVTAAEGVTGTHKIELKNIIFSTKEGIRYDVANSTANVTFIYVPTEEPELDTNNKFIINDTIIGAGQTIKLPVIMNNKNEICAFQCDIYLPEGVTLLKKRGKYDISLDENRKDDHSLTFADQADGAIRIITASLSNATFYENSGNLFYMNLKTAANFAGQLPITLKNIYLSDKDGNRYDINNATGVITCKVQNELFVENQTVRVGKSVSYPVELKNGNNISAIQCDIVLPEGMTLNDITLNESRKTDHKVSYTMQNDGTIRMTATSQNNSAFAGNEGNLFNLNIQTTRGFGGEHTVTIKNISVTDTNGQNFSVESVSSTINCEEYNYFILNEASTRVGQSISYPVFVENDSHISAFQCDIYLPEGITLQTKRGKYDITLDENRKDDHSVTSEQQSDGSIRMVVASLSNSLISGYNGNLFYLNLQSALGYDGNHTIAIKNICISDANGVRHDLEEVSGTINCWEYNALSINEANVSAGNSVVIPVLSENDSEIKEFKCDIYLPEGASLVTNTDNQYDITLNDSRKGNHYVTTTVMSNGAVRMTVKSNNNSTFTGNLGELFYINVKAGIKMDGYYDIALKNISITKPNGAQLNLEDTNSKIYVDPIILGDLDGDKLILVEDIVFVINAVLGITENIPVIEAGDMNCDGMYLVEDIVEVINAVLGVSTTSEAPMHRAEAQSVADKFYINDFNIAAGETKQLAIQLESNNVGSDPTQLNYVAFQFDIYLPEGLKVDVKRGKYNFAFNEARKDDHTLTFADQADGAIRVIGASLSNGYFWETSGDFVTFSVTAEDGFTGAKQLYLKNIKFSTKAGERADLDDVTVNINNDATGIENISSETGLNGNIYNVQGQKVREAGNTNSLPRGLYIINGKKVFIK